MATRPGELTQVQRSHLLMQVELLNRRKVLERKSAMVERLEKQIAAKEAELGKLHEKLEIAGSAEANRQVELKKEFYRDKVKTLNSIHFGATKEALETVNRFREKYDPLLESEDESRPGRY